MDRYGDAGTSGSGGDLSRAMGAKGSGSDGGGFSLGKLALLLVVGGLIWVAFIRPSDPQSAIVAEAEDIVRQNLRDPESAQFRDQRRSAKDRRVQCGQVNSRNGFGGMAGYRRYVADEAVGSVLFEGQNPGEKPGEGFSGKWALYCGRS